MQEVLGRQSRAVTIGIWIGTILVSVGIGLTGASKFVQSDHWRALFTGWGYPSWMSTATGVVEVAGAVGLLVPRLAFYAAMLLLTVMFGALVTLIDHRGGPLGWGGTPLVYIVLLVGIAAARRSRSREPVAPGRSSTREP
jgi:putative oxidoreductase